MVINTWNERTPTCIRHTMLAWIVMNFERGAYWIAFSVSSARLLSSPSSLHSTGEQWFPETGENDIPWLQVPAGLTPSDEVRSTRLWQTPIRDYWRTTSSMAAFLSAGSLWNRRNRLNCDVYGPSRKIDARPMASLEAFVASFFLPLLPPRGFDKCEWKSRKVNASLGEISRRKRKIFPIEKIWRTMWKLLSILIPFVPFFGRKFWQMEICKFEEFGKFSNWRILVKILDYICD